MRPTTSNTGTFPTSEYLQLRLNLRGGAGVGRRQIQRLDVSYCRNRDQPPASGRSYAVAARRRRRWCQ
jgi:hypothetical protein